MTWPAVGVVFAAFAVETLWIARAVRRLGAAAAADTHEGGLTVGTREHCPIEGKRRYASKQEARAAVGAVNRTVRAYRCEICDGWHITKRRTYRKPRHF